MNETYQMYEYYVTKLGLTFTSQRILSQLGRAMKLTRLGAGVFRLPSLVR